MESVASGTYLLADSMDTSKVVEVPGSSVSTGAQIALGDLDGQPEQYFTFTAVSDGYYSIASYSSGLYLTVSGFCVIQSAWAGTNSQLWSIRDTGNGTCNIVCRAGGVVLDVSGAATTAGTPVGVWTYNGGANQRFVMTASEPEHALATGIYTIGTALDVQMRLDGASYVSDDDAMGIGLWKSNGSVYQTFQITYLGNGYYTISDMGTGKYLDVFGGMTSVGTRVIQYQATGGVNQQWAILSNSDGTYRIQSRSASIMLDLTGVSSVAGTPLEIWSWNAGTNQRFTFTQARAPLNVLADGTYNITSGLSAAKALDIAGGSLEDDTELGLWTLNTGDNQKFTLTSVGDGCYVMEAVLSRKVLDVAGGSSTSGASVIQYTSNGGMNQRWLVEDSGTTDPSGATLYAVVSAGSGLAMTVAGGSAANGAKVDAETYTAAASQLFAFTATRMVPVISDGIYTITSSLDATMSLDVAGASWDDGANVELYTFINGGNQKFRITHAEDGYYTICALHSGKYLDVEGASTIAGANVSQYRSTGGANQLWRIYPNSDGTYSFMSGCGGLYLDLAGGSTQNGANIEVWTGNTSGAQRFGLVALSAGTSVVDLSQWNSVTDWSKVRSSTAFVILRTQDEIRLTMHGDAIDLDYDKYADACESYGIPYGCYMYMRSVTAADAIAEVDLYYRNATVRYGHNPLFFVLDVEEDGKKSDGSIDATKAITPDAVEAAVARLRELGATKIGIYYMVSCRDAVASSLPSVDFIWYARYGEDDGTIPGDGFKPPYPYDLWQYTSKATVDGVTNRVDMSLINTSGPNSRSLLWYIS